MREIKVNLKEVSKEFFIRTNRIQYDFSSYSLDQYISLNYKNIISYYENIIWESKNINPWEAERSFYESLHVWVDIIFKSSLNTIPYE